MKKLLSVLSVFAFATIAAGTASAGQIATPTGLNPGDPFRFVFVTTTTTPATSSALSTYDNIVSSEATGYTYGGNSPTWKAIVSNATTDASDHIGVSLTSTIPLFRVDGSQVSMGTLWDAGEPLEEIDKTIDGRSTRFEFVWTGTSFQDGAAYTTGFGERVWHVGPIDSARRTVVANSPERDQHFNAYFFDHSTLLPLYGISSVLTVPATVPEPSTVMLAGLGGLAAWAYSFKRKRN